MEYHYSLTGRMRGIFVGGLVLLAILVFAAGLLVGHEWGAIDATERASATQRGRLSPAPSLAPAPAAPPAAAPSSQAALGGGAPGGAIRPPDALPPPPAAPAVPAPPAVPKPPQAPAAPAIPAPPPLKSSNAVPDREMERSSAVEASGQRPAAVAPAAPAKKDRAKVGEAKKRGYVVYVGAFENVAKAESIAEELRDRGLAAKTSLVKKPGRKPLVTVWVGPFDARAGAEAVLPGIRAAGLEDTMIRAVP